jgi:EAL domain-containing protein (putative c-di-GMP-specific phosphodiesterase class I)/GGDEF domain-containing protein
MPQAWKPGTPMTNPAPSPDRHEQERLRLLRRTRLLDTAPTEDFDRITRLARQMFGMPIALMALVDENRQWFKSRQGMEATQTDRQSSFCTHAIAQGEVMVVEDALLDPRFAANPLVLGEPRIRFYAGAPLVLPSGHALGSLCVIDHQPRSFGAQEREQLATLAALVMSQIELHQRAGRINEVTRLPNRAQMALNLEAQRMRTPGERRGMLLIDVMQHQRLQAAVRAVGIAPLEGVLRLIAERLKDLLGPDWPIYHVSETRFCIRMQGDSREACEQFARRVVEHLETPFACGSVSVELEIEMGLVDFQLDQNSARDALRKAAAALQESSARGRRLLWHEDSFDAAHRRAFRLLQDVAPGLARGEFRLVYQPKLNLTLQAYSGVEALARWTHPVHGEISPGEFIPLIENSPLIHAFTRWVLNTALGQLAAWRAQGIDLTMALNVSSRNLDQPGFVDAVREICERQGVPINKLHVECTETSVMTHVETHEALLALQAMGAQISLDDFGMGYSNLACLHSLPVQLLKLDQSLIKPVDTDPRAMELVKSLISMGHSLGYRMLAEGVETRAVFDLVVAAGCDAIQGYYLSRPLEAPAIPAFMASQAQSPLPLAA